MKLTKNPLKRIIQEELARVISEMPSQHEDPYEAVDDAIDNLVRIVGPQEALQHLREQLNRIS